MHEHILSWFSSDGCVLFLLSLFGVGLGVWLGLPRLSLLPIGCPLASKGGDGFHLFWRVWIGARVWGLLIIAHLLSLSLFSLFSFWIEISLVILELALACAWSLAWWRLGGSLSLLLLRVSKASLWLRCCFPLYVLDVLCLAIDFILYGFDLFILIRFP